MKKSSKIAFFLLLLTSTILLGCRTSGTIGGNSGHETNIISKTDTVYARDSIYIEHWNTITQKNDTIYITEKQIEYKDRWRVEHKTDTFLVSKTDTLLVDVPGPERVVTVAPKWSGWSLLLNSVFVALVLLFIWRKLHQKGLLK